MPRTDNTSASRGGDAVRHTTSRGGATDRKALLPSVALCMRAVYAAFLWHEGIVHDAMACASFLKFNPTLPKDLPKDLTGQRQALGTASDPSQKTTTTSDMYAAAQLI